MSMDAHNKGASFRRQILADVQELVQRAISGVSAPISAQEEGAMVADQYRALNFLGAGVTLSVDAANGRVNVQIPGSVILATTTVLSDTTAKTLSLWNGSTNIAPPANWATVGFNDSGWSNAVVFEDASSPLPGTGAHMIWNSPRVPSNTGAEAIVLRESFTLPAGVISSATLQIGVDDFYNPGVYVNGTLIGSRASIGTVNTSVETYAIPSNVLIPGGSNVVAVRGQNDANHNDPGGNIIFILRVTQGSAPTSQYQQTKIRGTNNKTTTSTTFVVIDNTNLPALSFALSTGQTVRCILTGYGTNSSASFEGFGDFQVVQPTLGTTRCGSPAVSGTGIIGSGSSTMPVVVIGTFTAAESGTHTFQPVWRVSGGTGTLYNDSGVATHDLMVLFSAERVSG